MNPQVDRVGVAIVSVRGVIYAVADYSRAVKVLTPAEVEAAIGAIVHSRRLTLLADKADARAYCAATGKFNGTTSPRFVVRWQDSDVTHLPPSLEDHLRAGDYRQAAVGSCPALNIGGSFTSYRVAVLLY